MLDKVHNEFNDATLHLLLLLAMYGVRKDLHAWLGEVGDNLAHCEVSVVPKTAKGARPATHTIWHARLPRRLASNTQCIWSKYTFFCAFWPTILLPRTGCFIILHIAQGTRHNLILLKLHPKHEQLVIEYWNVNQPLLVLRLRSLLNWGERGLAVILCILKDRVNDIIPAAHLDRFEEALLIAHVLEDVGLKVAI